MTVEYGTNYLAQNEAVLAQLASGMSTEAYAFACEMAAEDDAEEAADEKAAALAAERAKRDAPLAADASGKRRQSGLSKLQRQTLDAMHPQGWTVADWIQPNLPIDPNNRQLGGSDSSNSYGGVHIVVNGAHVVLSRRGKWIGFFAWGGRQYPKNGGRKPWSALVATAAKSGPYGDHRVPGRGDLVRSYSLYI